MALFLILGYTSISDKRYFSQLPQVVYSTKFTSIFGEDFLRKTLFYIKINTEEMQNLWLLKLKRKISKKDGTYSKQLWPFPSGQNGDNHDTFVIISEKSDTAKLLSLYLPRN